MAIHLRAGNTTADGTGSTWDFETTTMPAHDVTLYAQWQKDENPNPAPNPTPNNDTTNHTKNAEKSSTKNLPKTGGYEALFMGILSLGIGLLACKKGLNKNKNK